MKCLNCNETHHEPTAKFCHVCGNKLNKKNGLCKDKPYQYSSSKPSEGVCAGHKWVDLGLPSGLKWATCNIGASEPSDYGDYFAWSETSPKSEYGTVMKYRKWGFLTSVLSKYCLSKDGYDWRGEGSPDNKTCLDDADDAARSNWGAGWRMPTKAEFCELRTNCRFERTVLDGINGHMVYSKKNDNCIFLPAAGFREYSSLDKAGVHGYYWSSSLGDSSNHAFGLWNARLFNFDRGCGFPVRPVIE